MSASQAAISWFRHVSAARKTGQTLPSGSYLEVFYEDLLADPIQGATQLFNYVGLPLSQDRLAAIVADQSFEKQKSIGGTPFPRRGEMAAVGKPAEPPGFFRSGQADAWRRELNWLQKLTIWRFTRKMMAKCGYNWSGRRAH